MQAGSEPDWHCLPPQVTGHTSAQRNQRSPRGRMGRMAKKRIGIMATAEAAATVTMSIDRRRVGSVGFSANAVVPAKKKTQRADASAMRKLITLLRRRASIVC